MSLLFGTAERAGHWPPLFLSVSVGEFCASAILNVGPYTEKIFKYLISADPLPMFLGKS
jgi:hypothetical protein